VYNYHKISFQYLVPLTHPGCTSNVHFSGNQKKKRKNLNMRKEYTRRNIRCHSNRNRLTILKKNIKFYRLSFDFATLFITGCMND